MFHPAIRFPSLPALILLILITPMAAQDKVRGDDPREQAHRSPDWPSVAEHLANPATATVQVLEMQGDILRARRFPYDALDYYGYALRREPNNTSLLKKMGVTFLELRSVDLAHAYFQKAVKLDKKDADAWNNLGAVEYLNRRFGNAVSNYRRAVKLKAKSAIYHSNLGIVYFDLHDYANGRKEMDTALTLDPNVFTEGGAGGVSAHVLSTEDRARFCLEMAKTFAQQGNEAEMLRSLERAAQAGLDVGAEMGRDKLLAGYRKDPRVLVLIQNAKALRSGNTVAAAGRAPPIASAAPAVE